MRTTSPRRWSGAKTLRRTHWSVIGIEAVVAVCALYAGVASILHDVIGSGTWPIRTPPANGVATGVVLILVVTVPMTAAAAIELARSVAAPLASILAGGALVAWVGGRMMVTQRLTVLVVLLLVVGLTVMVLAVAVRRHEPLVDPTRRRE
ncbi:MULTISPECIES: hypothetical protein [unclassified Pseudonocardia]|uniref:hypothetical protein n=1 Tax=unclassified Pseudonocardia TaxID=2619320 RepID=UPI0025DF8CE8|nr:MULTISPECIES: hypothetical protein [unclassified Pseudonocardia]